MLDLLFVVVLKTGVAGAALATVLSEAIAAILCIIYAFIKVPQFKMAFVYRKPDRKLLLKTLQVGLPTGLQYALIYVSSIILQRIVNGFGESVIGAFTATTQIELLVQQVFSALGAAMVTYTGQNMGAGKQERISQGVVAAMKISGIVSVILLAVFWIFGMLAVVGGVIGISIILQAVRKPVKQVVPRKKHFTKEEQKVQKEKIDYSGLGNEQGNIENGGDQVYLDHRGILIKLFDDTNQEMLCFNDSQQKLELYCDKSSCLHNGQDCVSNQLMRYLNSYSGVVFGVSDSAVNEIWKCRNNKITCFYRAKNDIYGLWAYQGYLYYMNILHFTKTKCIFVRKTACCIRQI